MKLHMKVTFVDGEETLVTAQFPDFVSFERTWQRSVARFEQELRLTDLAWLAWSSLTRAKLTGKKFDPEWIETVANVEAVDTPSDTPLETIQPTGQLPS
jgi:hypothetical protein